MLGSHQQAGRNEVSGSHGSAKVLAAEMTYSQPLTRFWSNAMQTAEPKKRSSANFDMPRRKFRFTRHANMHKASDRAA